MNENNISDCQSQKIGKSVELLLNHIKPKADIQTMDLGLFPCSHSMDKD